MYVKSFHDYIPVFFLLNFPHFLFWSLWTVFHVFIIVFLLLLRLSFLLLLFCKWILCHVQTGTGGSATDGNLRNVSWCRHPQPNCIMESEEPSKAGRWWFTGEWRQKCFFFVWELTAELVKKSHKNYMSLYLRNAIAAYTTQRPPYPSSRRKAKKQQKTEAVEKKTK